MVFVRGWTDDGNGSPVVDDLNCEFRSRLPSVRVSHLSDAERVTAGRPLTPVLPVMDLLQGHLSNIRVPQESDRVFKDECLFSFDSPVSISRNLRA